MAPDSRDVNNYSKRGGSPNIIQNTQNERKLAWALSRALVAGLTYPENRLSSFLFVHMDTAQ